MKKIAAFGEVMLRLNPELYLRLEQSHSLNMSFTGTGLNVLAGLSNYGYNTQLISVLPNNRIGEVCLGEIRKIGINDDLILQSGNHMGVYLIELGYGARPSEVTYLNRKNSAFNEYIWSDSEIERSLRGIEVLHLCGIAISTSLESRNNMINFAKIAKSKGITLCFDFNFRPSLNGDISTVELVDTYKKVLMLADIVVGSSRDLYKLYGYETSLDQFTKDYDIEMFLGTEKYHINDKHEIRGFAYQDGTLHYSDQMNLNSVDRIGTGDAFVSGFLSQYFKNESLEFALNFGVTSAQLSHTTLNDYPLLSESFIKRVMQEKTDVFR